MAYDKEQAHEYYEKYRKKGLLKGRKKGKGKKKNAKKGKTATLIGVSSSGLNTEGKIEAQLIKDRLKQEMNTKLAGAKTQEERDKIRADYSKQAQAEMDRLKTDPKYAQAKKAKSAGSKAKSAGSSAKGSASKGGASEKASKAPTISPSAISNLKRQLEAINKLKNKAAGSQRTQLLSSMKTILNVLKELRGLSADEQNKYEREVRR